MPYPLGTGASPSAVGTGIGYAPSAAPSGATTGSGPLAAAMRETGARPMRYAPGAVPKIPYGGAKSALPFKPLVNPTASAFGKKLPGALAGTALSGLTGMGARLAGRLLGSTALGLAWDLGGSFLPFGWDPRRVVPIMGGDWVLLCRSPGILNGWRFGSNNPNLACPIPFQVPSGAVVDPVGSKPPMPANTGWIAFGNYVNPRMTITEQWLKRTPQIGVPLPITWELNTPMVTNYPVGIPVPETIPWAQLDPMMQPIGAPTKRPRPIPYRLIPHRRPNPFRSPDEQPSGSQPTQPRPIPVERDDPRTIPAWETQVTPGGPPPPGKPGKHVLRPPGRREKEKKVIMSVASGSMLGQLINLVTESLDALNVAWESLPWQVRKQLYKPNPWEKFVHIMTNLDKIQPGTFVAGFLSNQLEDKAFGKLGKIAGQAARKAYNDGFGNLQFQRGPADEGGPRPEGLGRDPYIDWLDRHMWGWV